jgi:type I restriction enzyme M protein
MATVLPHGVLFRGGDERGIRAGMIEDDLLEAVIGVAPNLFYGTGIPACILVLRKQVQDGANRISGKTAERQGKVLFINADREYFEGRAQNYLLPEHIEKIVSTIEAFEDVPGFARVVEISELRENDYNLNIRRYADNTPDPEPQDVRAHLVGGIPLKEVRAKQALFDAHGFDPMALFKARASDAAYVDFADGLNERADLKPAIEANLGLQSKEARLRDAFEAWWREHGPHITALTGNGKNLTQLREDVLTSFTAALEPLAMLDPFAVRGIIAGFWEQNKNEFRTLQARGVTGVVDAWRTSIITLLEDEQSKANPLDHKLVGFLLADYVAALEELQARKAELDAQIKAAEATPEDDEEAAEADEDAPTSEQIKGWKAERTKVTKQLKEQRARFEAHLNAAVDALDAAAAAELVLTILHNDLSDLLERYVRQQRQQIVAAFETWWDKYRVTLTGIETERDAAAKQLRGYLEALGYV